VQTHSTHVHKGDNSDKLLKMGKCVKLSNIRSIKPRSYCQLCTGGFTIVCPLLADLTNGVMTCSLGDDGVASYEDTCSFTCNTGYVLTGSTTRTCQSDRSWSGSETSCRKGTKCIKFCTCIVY